MISGCHSEQTSADVVGSGNSGGLPNPMGRSGGACTTALLDILYQSSHQTRIHDRVSDKRHTYQQLTFQQLLVKLRSTLSERGFEQIPQLTSSRPLEMNQTPFSCVSPFEKNPGNCRRALLVGINYLGQSGELVGCHNDVFRMRKYLIEEQGYAPKDIVVLVDDGRSHFPNRATIIKVLDQLVVQSKAGDSVFFHYSGHGGLVEPSISLNPWKRSLQEYDEILYPLDHERVGYIRDYSLFRHFVQPMPAGVTVTCVMDCCHSGSVLDLPYSYRPTSAGSITMKRNLTSLNNLALLYLLSGGHFPTGGLFDNVANSLEGVTGESVDSLTGSGMGESDEVEFESNDDEGFASVGDADQVDPLENTGVDAFQVDEDSRYDFDYRETASPSTMNDANGETWVPDMVTGDENDEEGDALDCGDCLSDVLRNLTEED